MTPLWVGFNSLIVIDNNLKQKISYLNPINASPTDKEIVYESLIIYELILHKSAVKNLLK